MACLPVSFDAQAHAAEFCRADESRYGTLDAPRYTGPRAKQYPFSLDPFQETALACMERRESVLVGACAGEHWRARFHMALLSIGQGWHDQGEALLRGVLERNPDHADSQDILAKLVERLGTPQVG